VLIVPLDQRKPNEVETKISATNRAPCQPPGSKCRSLEGGEPEITKKFNTNKLFNINNFKGYRHFEVAAG
jgi:hypothetical protein